MTNCNQKERFQTKIAMLEQNNQVLRNKCEEYLGELEHTRKALDVAVDVLKYTNKCIKGGCVNWETEIDRALEQITALEQKDVK